MPTNPFSISAQRLTNLVRAGTTVLGTVFRVLVTGVGNAPSATYSTIASDVSSFPVDGSATITFTAKDAGDTPVEGYVPSVESGVT